MRPYYEAAGVTIYGYPPLSEADRVRILERFTVCPFCGAQQNEPCRVIRSRGAAERARPYAHQARWDAGEALTP